MSPKLTIDVPLNRVEGDLEVRVELQDGVVTDAWCSGTLYRGLERLLVGRGALDGLVLTPRICGICSTSHLSAAVRALDSMAGAQVPPDAVRVRNLAVMAEHVQSDLRHVFLMFTADLANPAYCNWPFYAEAQRRYEPLKGETVLDVLKQTRSMLELIALFGGQWPHSSYMVPGGIVSLPSTGDILQARHLVRLLREWYERRVLGCAIERWQDVRGEGDLDAWLEETPSHRDGELGFLVRCARDTGMDRMGHGYANFLSFGGLELPDVTRVRAPWDGGRFVPAGFAHGAQVEAFDQAAVAEHVAASWFVDYPGGRHPFDGETRPYASGHEGRKYSWAKAPRYGGQPAETGPLAEMVVARDPLFVDLVQRGGASVLARELARLARPARFLPAMETWLEETTGGGKFYVPAGDIDAGSGAGLVEAARGALGHWVHVAGGVIERYQIITPTAWNASPRDDEGRRGPMEAALVGTQVCDPDNPVEVGHVVRSFDPCLVCTVHALRVA